MKKTSEHKVVTGSHSNIHKVIFTVAQSELAKKHNKFAALVKKLETDKASAVELSNARLKIGEQYFSGDNSLKALRLKAGLSQALLAKKIGGTQPQIATYESGKSEPSLTTSKRLAEALGTDLNGIYIAIHGEQLEEVTHE